MDFASGGFNKKEAIVLSFSENLQSCMEEKGATAYRVAKDNGIKQTTVSNWLGGKTPNVYLALRVAKYFGKRLEEMIGDEDSWES